ncbi:MAG: HAD hydrolase family protein, partial [Acidimicrobiia bacterium]|nr:HAD hydrolase family protein [Acidimicrobiia bacterium]
FDGVHTDDRAVVADDGSESVIVSRADGHGIKLLRHAGVPVLILSTETNGVVSRRAEKLRVECLQGIDDKWTALQHWLRDHDIGAAEAAYVGNDVNDLECMAHVGLAIAVADADPIVRAAAAHVTSRRGGRGAVREIADLLAAHRTTVGDHDAADRDHTEPPRRRRRQGASL